MADTFPPAPQEAAKVPRTRSRAPRERPDDPLALNLARILFRLLTNPRGWRVDELQAELKIADRTYRKYRSLLQQHFDGLVDRQGSLIVEAQDGDARYLRLRDSEEPVEEHPRFLARVAALELARQAFAFLRPTGIGEDLDAFRQEFLDRAGDHTFVFRQLLRDLDRKLVVAPEACKDYSDHGARLATVLHGLMYCKRLKVDYLSAKGRIEEGVIEPLTLLVWRGALYVVVRFKGSRKRYYLALDRMKEVTKTGEVFRYPSPADYRPADLLDGSFGIYREPGARPRVYELIFANERWLKMYVRERHWHPTQAFEDLPDGRLRMTFTAVSVTDVMTWIRGFGDAVEVVRPNERGSPVAEGGTR